MTYTRFLHASNPNHVKKNLKKRGRRGIYQIGEKGKEEEGEEGKKRKREGAATVANSNQGGGSERPGREGRRQPRGKEGKKRREEGEGRWRGKVG